MKAIAPFVHEHFRQSPQSRIDNRPDGSHDEVPVSRLLCAQVRRSFQQHPWVFAYYFQTPEERDDGKWCHAIVFRNEDRTEFGAFEFVAEGVTFPDFERRYDKGWIAARSITDAEFRDSLLRDSPDLREL